MTGGAARRLLGAAALACAAACVTAAATTTAQTSVRACATRTPSAAWCGDGGPATRARLNRPQQVAALPGGGFLVADTGNGVIRKVDASGIISTVAGIAHTAGDTGDGGPATAAKLDGPTGVAALPGGGFAVADTGNHRVRIVDAQGTITAFATDANFLEPRSLVARGDGQLLVADAGRDSVVSLTPAGLAQTFAGNGIRGLSGDFGPAAAARLKEPTAVAIDRNGGVLIADSANYRIRRVAADGTIRTIAGGGLNAGLARFTPLVAVVDTPNGVLISDGANVRRLRSDGVAARVAGTGRIGFNGDRGVATAISVGYATSLAVAGDGSVLIADSSDDRVRRLTPDGRLTTVGGAGTPPGTAGAPSPTRPATQALKLPHNGRPCTGQPAAGDFSVRFAYPGAITLRRRPGHALSIKLALTAKAKVTLTVAKARPGAKAKRITARLTSGTHAVRIGRLAAGRYVAAVHATGRSAQLKREVHSCATAPVRVTGRH